MTVAAARRAALRPAALLCAGLAAAVALRVEVAGNTGSASAPAGVLFGAVLLGVALAGGWRPARPSWRTVAAGAGGALVLLAVPLALRVAAPPVFRLGSPAGGFPVWAGVVTLVAVAEEGLLRGALMGVLLRRTTPELAVGVAAVAFALLHVPVYGWVALPLDLAVGVWLGGLRLATWWLR